jgi:hypothetical protein
MCRGGFGGILFEGSRSLISKFSLQNEPDSEENSESSGKQYDQADQSVPAGFLAEHP